MKHLLIGIVVAILAVLTVEVAMAAEPIVLKKKYHTYTSLDTAENIFTSFDENTSSEISDVDLPAQTIANLVGYYARLNGYTCDVVGHVRLKLHRNKNNMIVIGGMCMSSQTTGHYIRWDESSSKQNIIEWILLDLSPYLKDQVKPSKTKAKGVGV